jgi:hypothetical protein
MPEENEFTNPASGAAGDKDAEAVLGLQEIPSEEPDVEAHMMISATSVFCDDASAASR